MRERPKVGDQVAHGVTVMPDMTARLFGRQVHPVYATAWFVRHVEEAGRLLIERYLSRNEDATGFRIELTHEGPAFVGDRVTITARATEVTDDECVCSFEAHGPAGVVGHGVFVQRYVPRGKLEAAARQRRHGG
jgi:fluoroacetyl-CoA thioesterase